MNSFRRFTLSVPTFGADGLEGLRIQRIVGGPEGLYREVDPSGAIGFYRCVAREREMAGS